MLPLDKSTLFFCCPAFSFRVPGLFFLAGGDNGSTESEAAVDGNMKEVTDRVACLWARLGKKEQESYAARASPLWYKHEWFAFCVAF